MTKLTIRSNIYESTDRQALIIEMLRFKKKNMLRDILGQTRALVRAIRNKGTGVAACTGPFFGPLKIFILPFNTNLRGFKLEKCVIQTISL